METVMMIGAAVVFLLVLRAVATRGERIDHPDGFSPDAVEVTEDSIRGLLLGGRKIEAIKAYRRLHRVDLMEAKEGVERLAEKLPPST
jgi:ribosomal protein L7/L12